MEGGQGILSPTSTKWISERLNDRAHGGNRGLIPSEIVVKEPGNDRTEVATGAITSEMRQTEHTLWKAERLNLNLQDKE